jgi:D-sedoheptulose 7-phosphate isomerase
MELQKLLDLYRIESIANMQNLDLSLVAHLAKLIIQQWERGHSIFIMGNGGNAAFAANWATDLNIHPFVSENKDKPLEVKKRLKVFNLSNDPATITGILNDLGAENIFVEQLKYLSKPGDLLIGLSGSANSANIKKAFTYGLDNGMFNVLITRNKDGECYKCSDLNICIDGNSTFPGQMGKNLNNFHYEDMISKISHMTVGILKQVVYESQ